MVVVPSTEHWLPLLLGLAAGVSTFFGGLIALSLGRHLRLVTALTAGAVLGVALFDLMPEALAIGAGFHDVRTLFGVMAIGFSAYMMIERTVAARATRGLRSILGPASLTLHSFVDGMAIGLAFNVSTTVGAMVALAVLAHDLSDGVNIIGLCLAGDRPERARKWLVANTLAPLTGVVVARFIDLPAATLSLLLGAFSGLFLYIGACELLPRSSAVGSRFLATAATIIGMAAMYLVVFAADR